VRHCMAVAEGHGLQRARRDGPVHARAIVSSQQTIAYNIPCTVKSRLNGSLYLRSNKFDVRNRSGKEGLIEIVDGVS
jgi:hypothetical protein